MSEATEAAQQSLEQIQNLLFGAQMKNIEQRLAKMEQRLQKEAERVQASIEKRVAAIDGYTRKEIAALQERLGTERKERAAGDKDIERSLKEAQKSLDGQLKSVTADTAEELETLQADKASRGDLAALFADLSTHLGQEPKAGRRSR